MGGGGGGENEKTNIINNMLLLLLLIFLLIQSDLGYPATLGPALIRISDLSGYEGYNTASSIRFIQVIMYLLIATVFVTNYRSYKLDI